MTDIIPLKFKKTGTTVTALAELETGDQIPAGFLPAASGGSDKAYTFTQPTAASTWVVPHNLGKFPSVSVVDTAGNWGIGAVKYTDANNLTITFGAPFAGKAYCN